jgi:hypothetical protein
MFPYSVGMVSITLRQNVHTSRKRLRGKKCRFEHIRILVASRCDRMDFQRL